MFNFVNNIDVLFAMEQDVYNKYSIVLYAGTNPKARLQQPARF